MTSHLLLLFALISSSVCWAAQTIDRKEVTSRCMEVPRSDLESCIIKLVNELQPYFAEGIPEFNLAPQRAIKMREFSFREWTNEQSFMMATFNDIVLKGVDEIQLVNLTIDYDSHVAKAKTNIPEILVSGKYDMNASIVLVPLQGHSTFWMRLNDVVMDVTLTFGAYKMADDKYHFESTGAEVDFDYKDVSVRLNDLFNGDTVLKEAAETVIQQNSRDIIAYAKPTIVKQIQTIGLEVSRDILQVMELDELAGNQYIKKAFNITS